MIRKFHAFGNLKTADTDWYRPEIVVNENPVDNAIEGHNAWLVS